jgi:ATP-dependent Zn protease
MNGPEEHADPFAHLKRQAAARSDRTVERLSAAIAALRANGQKITAESLKQATRELDPGFAGLSFQVIRRNPRAYALYREAADAFSVPATNDEAARSKRRRRRRVRGSTGRSPRSSYDPLQRFDKKELVQRIRSLEQDLDTERQRRSALAYDQQTLLAKMIRLETEMVLLKAERSQPE